MGMGPWAQGDLIRDTEKTERARFRRLLAREEKYLRSLITKRRSTGGVMRGDLEGAFSRIRSGLKPKPRKETPKKIADDRWSIGDLPTRDDYPR